MKLKVYSSPRTQQQQTRYPFLIFPNKILIVTWLILMSRAFLALAAKTTRNSSSLSAAAAAASSSITTSGSTTMNDNNNNNKNKNSMKRLYIVRHGQAMHNPRAEVAKENGCSMEEFFELMRQDDVLDAPLTAIGKEQGRLASFANKNDHDDDDKNSNNPPSMNHHIDLVVASSLSRAIQTADLIYPTTALTTTKATTINNRISLEYFREVSGDMLNAKRRTRTELQKDFPLWNFDNLVEENDTLWTEEMETFEAAAERGYQGLCWLLNRPEQSILLVSHGGILRYMMNIHPLIQLRDGRTKTVNEGITATTTKSEESSKELKPVESRFDNCEVRGYNIQWNEDEEENENDETCATKNKNGGDFRRSIILTQIDH